MVQLLPSHTALNPSQVGPVRVLKKQCLWASKA